MAFLQSINQTIEKTLNIVIRGKFWIRCPYWQYKYTDLHGITKSIYRLFSHVQKNIIDNQKYIDRVHDFVKLFLMLPHQVYPLAWTSWIYISSKGFCLSFDIRLLTYTSAVHFRFHFSDRTSLLLYKEAIYLDDFYWDKLYSIFHLCESAAEYFSVYILSGDMNWIEDLINRCMKEQDHLKIFCLILDRNLINWMRLSPKSLWLLFMLQM